jgi:hypothetical protein
VGTPRCPTDAGQAAEDYRFRTGLTHRAAGWPQASPVRVEIPVRADPPPEAGKEAAPNQRRRDHPREAPGITLSFARLGSQQQFLSVDGAVPKDMVDGLRQLMRDDLRGDEFATFATMAAEVTVDAALELHLVPEEEGYRVNKSPGTGARLPAVSAPLTEHKGRKPARYRGALGKRSDPRGAGGSRSGA